MEQRDAGCTLQYIHPGEIQRLGLTEAKIAKLFDIIDAETGFFDAAPIATEPFEDDVNTLTISIMKVSETHEMGLVFHALPTEYGPKVVGFVTSLSYLPIVSTRPRGQPHAQGIAKVKLQREQAIWAEQRLKPIGIEGIVSFAQNAGGDGLVYYSWSDLRQRADKRIANSESRGAAEGT